MTLPLEQLWNQGLDQTVQRDVLKILSRIAARPATRKPEKPDDQSPAIARATPACAMNLRNVASKENADD